MTQTFDVVIVGAGSAGSVLANRLSADPACSVCLLEAGEWPSDPDIADPFKWPTLGGRDYDWAYRTVSQAHTAGRVHEWPRGRVVGGSSCLNAMAHVRGHPDDFRAWAEAGGETWSYDSLLPAFIRSETFTAFEHPAHGRDGPFDVHLPDHAVSPVARAFMAAGMAMGVPALADHNSAGLIGTSPNSLNIRGGRRISVADAYLTPAVRVRPNLTIVTGCVIERLRATNGKIDRLLAVTDGRVVEIRAATFILCAGAIASPLILMRSGIGDPETLAAAGIACLADRSEIGRNLQDHLLGLGNVYRARKPVPPSRLQHSESLMYLDSADVTRADGRPDIVLACVVAPSVAPEIDAPAYGSAYTILFGVTGPTSRGRILPGGPRHDDPPIIDPQYLETRYDRETFRSAFEHARAIGHHAALNEWRAEEVLPAPGISSPAQADAFIARVACTHHHPCGTCRMGKDADAVVDPDLRVNGFDNLHVVDASIIPRIPSGPINAAVVAMAEHWSAGFQAW